MRSPKERIMRGAVLFCGAVSYLGFLVTFLYAIGFVGDFAVVPKGIDDGVVEPAGRAVLIDVALLALFAVQHTIMARPAFKERWTRVVPAAIERTTFVLAATLLLALMMWQWRPLPEVVWHADGVLAVALWSLFGAGWAVVLISTWLIDHFDLFGLRQVWLFFTGRPYAPPPFVERAFYKNVRHPLMLGFLVAFWFTPHMTQGHLLFAGVTTAYILVAIQIEERDLVRLHGHLYGDYRRRVSMLLPLGRRRGR
jgi:protein-S-isoprenylcysteine O-methyltransferase Ste14